MAEREALFEFTRFRRQMAGHPLTWPQKELDVLLDIAAAARQVQRSSFPDDPQAFTVQERRLSDALSLIDWTAE